MPTLTLTHGTCQYDDADAPLVERFTWHSVKSNDGNRYYASTSIDGRTIYMHRLIVNPQRRSDDIDHRNRDGLDNRKANLRIASRSQNMANTRSRGGSSQFKGVSRTPGGKWFATIQVNAKTRYLGTFADEQDAARAYDAAALAAWGEFARLNLPKAG